MKKILFISLLLSLNISLCFAYDESKLDQANALYDQEMFLEAAQLYEEVLMTKGSSPELYYNLGNAYFKVNEIALAILNYERALRLQCDFTDAKYNLEFAKTKTVDEIKDTKDFFLKRWTSKLMLSYSSNKWFYICWTAYLFSLLSVMLFFFSKKISIRKFTFTITLIAILVASISFIFSTQQKKYILEQKYAIVMPSVVTVRSSPGQGSTPLFELHEGTKVEIKTLLEQWVEIIIADERKGWVESSQIERI